MLDTLGLAGNLKTAHIFNAIRRGDASGAITQFGELYASGKEVTAVLSELTSLSRDLLIRQTAPGAALSLMTGGYDEATLNTLTKNMPPERLIAILQMLEQAVEDCKRSGSSRTVAEICLIRLCDPSLDGSNAGLAARIAKLEAAVAQGVPARPAQQSQAAPAPTSEPEQAPWDETMPPPPGEEDAPPLESEPEAPQSGADPVHPSAAAQPSAPTARPEPEAASAPAGEWPKLVAAMHGVVRMPAYMFLKNPTNVVGVRQGNLLSIFFQDEFAFDQVNKPDVLKAIAEVVSAQLGISVQVELRKGLPDQEKSKLQAPPKPVGSMNDLKNFMQQHQK